MGQDVKKDENGEGRKEDDRKKEDGKEGDGKGNGEVDGVNDGEDNREGNNGEGPELEVPTWEGEHPLHPFANGLEPQSLQRWWTRFFETSRPWS